MKRICSLCLQEIVYHNVKRYKHGLQLCGHCQDVIAELSLPVVPIFKHR
jgi:ribosomal protein L37AE/L43A